MFTVSYVPYSIFLIVIVFYCGPWCFGSASDTGYLQQKGVSGSTKTVYEEACSEMDTINRRVRLHQCLSVDQHLLTNQCLVGRTLLMVLLIRSASNHYCMLYLVYEVAPLAP